MRYNVPRPPCMEYPRSMREQGQSDYPYYGGAPIPEPYPTYPPYAKPYPPYINPDYENPMYPNPPYMNPAYPNNPYTNMPGNEMPEYVMPNPNKPGYEMPEYIMPNPNKPGYEMPENVMPNPNMPGYEMPEYIMPNPNKPGYEMPEHVMPNPNMPGNEMPENVMPNPNMPGNEMPDNVMPKPNMPEHEHKKKKYCPHGMESYTVRHGDTLYAIAKMYGISVDDIMAANPQIVTPNVIYAGQLLCIPHQKQCEGFLYTIKPGDTLYNIAMSFGMSLEELLQANPHINPESYRDGETICIPEINPCPGNTMVYVVKKDDSLTSILTETNVSLNALMAANPEFDPYNITPRTRLCVIPTPCEPVCPKEKRMTIPDSVNNINQLANLLKSTTDAILLANPNFPPCHFKAPNTFCIP